MRICILRGASGRLVCTSKVEKHQSRSRAFVLKMKIAGTPSPDLESLGLKPGKRTFSEPTQALLLHTVL